MSTYCYWFKQYFKMYYCQCL